MAGEEQIETLFTDCEPDAVPALGAAYGLDILVDESLAQQPEIYLECGDHDSLVHISGIELPQADGERPPRAVQRTGVRKRRLHHATPLMVRSAAQRRVSNHGPSA